MDISLSRILSLIPKDESGKYKHGSKAKFARSIGYDSGDIVSMWENGSSVSYKKKIHEIAAKYNVSIEWLKGETDEKGIKKQPAANSDELTETQKYAFDMLKTMDDSEIKLLIDIFKTVRANRQESKSGGQHEQV